MAAAKPEELARHLQPLLQLAFHVVFESMDHQMLGVAAVILDAMYEKSSSLQDFLHI